MALVFGPADAADLCGPSRIPDRRGDKRDLLPFDVRENVIQRPLAHSPGAIGLASESPQQNSGPQLIAAAHQLTCFSF
jgi:hypothetical protein